MYHKLRACATWFPEFKWVRQLRWSLYDTEANGQQVEILMRDNDGKYSKEFDAVFADSKIQIKKNTPASPNLRTHVERFIQTFKHECLNKFVIISESQLNHINQEFEEWYNEERPHTACDHLPPDWSEPLSPTLPINKHNVVCKTRLGGTLKSYSRRAA